MRIRAALSVMAMALAAAPASAQAAESFWGVTQSGRLVRFHSDSPGAIRAANPITGLAESEHLVGLDRRPANGQLYGVGTASYLYRVDALGRATRISPDLFDVAVQGSSFGLDFDPVTDRLRLVSDQEQNMRIDPNTGRMVDGTPVSVFASPDSNLRFAPGSGNGDPNVGAAVYLSDGRMFGIDATRDAFYRIDPPNGGAVRSVGPLGVKAADPVGLDQGSDGQIYASFRREGRREPELWRIDSRTGRAVKAARFPTLGSRPTGRGLDPIIGLTATGPVAADRNAPSLRLVKGGKLPITKLRKGKPHVLRVRCSETCRLTVRLLRGRRTIARFTKDVPVAGTANVRLRLDRKARKRFRGGRKLRFTVAARDAAGNVTRGG